MIAQVVSSGVAKDSHEVFATELKALGLHKDEDKSAVLRFALALEIVARVLVARLEGDVQELFLIDVPKMVGFQLLHILKPWLHAQIPKTPKRLYAMLQKRAELQGTTLLAELKAFRVPMTHPALAIVKGELKRQLEGMDEPPRRALLDNSLAPSPHPPDPVPDPSRPGHDILCRYSTHNGYTCAQFRAQRRYWAMRSEEHPPPLYPRAPTSFCKECGKVGGKCKCEAEQ